MKEDRHSPIPIRKKGNKEPVTLAVDLSRFKKKKPESSEHMLADLRKDISNLSRKMKNPVSTSPSRGLFKADFESTKQTNDSNEFNY